MQGTPFTSFSFTVTGATINGTNYGSPSTGLIPNDREHRNYNWGGNCTFTAVPAMTVSQGSGSNIRRFRLTFNQWTIGTYSGTYPDAEGRISISGNSVTVDTSYNEYSQAYTVARSALKRKPDIMKDKKCLKNFAMVLFNAGVTYYNVLALSQFQKKDSDVIQ